jgi:hypothetical protein
MSSALVWAVSAVVLVPLLARRVLTAGAMTPPVANAHRHRPETSVIGRMAAVPRRAPAMLAAMPIASSKSSASMRD